MIEIGKKYGCLTVLDDGEEYKKTEKYLSLLEELNDKKQELEPFILQKKKLIDDNPDLYEKWKECIKQKRMESEIHSFHSSMYELCFKIKMRQSEISRIESKTSLHYKCQCRCGKVHYYNEKTLGKKPKFCIYPVSYANNKGNYSIRAQNATYRKLAKYEGIENVVLWEKGSIIEEDFNRWLQTGGSLESKDYSLPSDTYCDLYNDYKTKQIIEKEQVLAETIAQIPRVNAKNYDVDFCGKQYESLYVEECVDDHFESEPHYGFTQRHKKYWYNITVYKRYKCRCLLCGKEQLVTCNKFGIYPPTEYGYNAYNGYWSDVYCDCHPISSFQWIVTKILFENDVPYAVEYSFDDLYGCGGVNQLRFDFAIFNRDGSIKCLIECQGEQHFRPVEEFGGEEQFKIQVKNDSLKRQYAENHNIKLMEISYKTKKIEQVEEILRQQGIID
ncbi:hypothetical protein D6853_09165 [Butyrivibrio sp. X503]|uniref:hypothetical protein n=1 Tax=Butyrivibrio sp. X503 TaxID=2364878 RepID=UPI000EA8B59F|nr:hypothetical protein [Butyrivibrio sp. X503]RKM55714.1 hypothetical protein D6853_09165 [Butyrivibrio sp. X503]